jgi:endo-1,4-beta-xylanase
MREGGCTLREAADRADVFIGAAVEPRHIEADSEYGPVLAEQFNSLTSENVLKWQPIHPEPDRYEFGPGDALVDFAEANGMRVRGHALFWGRLSLPDYVREASSPEEALGLLTEHIETVAGHYAGRIAQWDVVNEPLTLGGALGETGGFDDHVMYRQLGPGYIATALELAHAADPHAELFINDFLVIQPGAKQDLFFALAEDLVASGAPLHGVGLQGHFSIPSSAEVEATVARFAALGLRVELTELDYPLSSFGGDADAKLSAQADAYRRTVAGCIAHPACSGITAWGFTDRYTWLGSESAPLLFDTDYGRKPAYFAVRDEFIANR